jgi:hypothetical protein
MVMRKHQRYFPVYQHQSDALLPHFVTVANGEVDIPTVQVRPGIATLRFCMMPDEKAALLCHCGKWRGGHPHSKGVPSLFLEASLQIMWPPCFEVESNSDLST